MKMISLLLAFALGICSINAQTKYPDDVADITEEQKELLALKICMLGYGSWGETDALDEFDRGILRQINSNLNDPNREKKVADFMNTYASCLICDDDGSDGIRENEHIYKRMVSTGLYRYLHIAIIREYPFDLNVYEIIDGKKETLLDFVYMIIDGEEYEEDYDILGLEALARSIKEKGGKRGSELD